MQNYLKGTILSAYRIIGMYLRRYEEYRVKFEEAKNAPNLTPVRLDWGHYFLFYNFDIFFYLPRFCFQTIIKLLKYNYGAFRQCLAMIFIYLIMREQICHNVSQYVRINSSYLSHYVYKTSLITKGHKN